MCSNGQARGNKLFLDVKSLRRNSVLQKKFLHVGTRQQLHLDAHKMLIGQKWGH